MTSPLIYPAQVQWLGVAPETTYGTPASAPTMWVPVVPNTAKWKPVQTMLEDDGLRGDMATLHGIVAGVRYDTLDYQCYLTIDNLFQHLQAIYGGADHLTGSSDPYTHKVGLLNNTATFQPTSCTLWYFDGAECWQLPGAQMAQLDVDTKVTEKGNVTASWMGLPATKVTAPSNTPSTKPPWPSWNTTLIIGGTTTTNYSEAKLTFKRECSAQWGLAGTQSPYVIFVGGLTVTGSLTAIYQGYAATVSDLANYLANTQPTTTLQVNPAGDSTHYGKWTFTTLGYSDVAVQEGAKFMETSANVQAIANTTDATDGGASPGNFTLLSPVSTAYGF